MQYSIVNFSKVKYDSNCLRIDAEFFKSEYLDIENVLNNICSKELRDYNVKIYHPNEIKREYVNYNGILFLRAQNVRPLQIDLESNKVYVSKEDALKLIRNQIRYGDILLTRTGANFGECAIYLCNDKAICSSHTFIIRSKEINPFFLTIFLNTLFGRKLIDKGMYGGAQQEIAPFYLYRIPIPVFSQNMYNLIERIYKCSFDLLSNSQKLYAEAERILLSELGLLDWQPERRLSYTRSFSETKSAGRIDAEYFKPEYDEITARIKSYKHGWDYLGNMVDIKDEIFNPLDDKIYKYIELSNISNYGEITGISEEYGILLPSRARRKVNTNDVIISSIEGSLNSIALINQNLDNCLCSTGFFVINSKKINSETLLCLLKTIIGQKQLKKGCSGTILTAINKDEFSKIILPKIDNDIQYAIQLKIKEMYHLKDQSRQLLEIAKRGVETAIEQDEQSAQTWIDGQLKILNINLDE